MAIVFGCGAFSRPTHEFLDNSAESPRMVYEQPHRLRDYKVSLYYIVVLCGNIKMK